MDGESEYERIERERENARDLARTDQLVAELCDAMNAFCDALLAEIERAFKDASRRVAAQVEAKLKGP